MSQSSKEQIVAVNPIVHIQAVRENLKYYRSISKSTDSEQIKQAYITTYRAMNTAWNAFTDDPYLKTIRDLIIERKAKEIVVARPSLSPDPVEQSRYLSTSRELFSWYPDWTDGNPITQKDKSLARNNVMTNASRVLDVLEEALGIKPDLKLIDAGMLKHYAVQASFVPPDRQHEFYKSRAILQMAMTQGGTVVGVNSGIYNLESRSPVYFWHTSDDTKLSSVMKNLQVKEDGLGGVEVAYEPDEDITVTNLWAVSNDCIGCLLFGMELG